jgi:hypothetical protein
LARVLSPHVEIGVPRSVSREPRIESDNIFREPPVQTYSAVLLVAALAAQTYPPPYPRTNATRLLDTDRIAVWDMVWPKGEPSPTHRHVHDQVGTYYVAGGRLITALDGTSRTNFTEVGALSTTVKDTTHVEEGTTDPALRAVFIELKQERSSGRPDATADVPPLFPRDGAKGLLDTDRTQVWDYTWHAGGPASTYVHPRDTVVVWLAPGTIRLTPRNGPAVVVTTKIGQMMYKERGTVETLEVVDGSPRSYSFELK